ncbi:MAG TPA: Crp/Fnr family transcriptional regulator [Flavobacterium sp.]|jgi:CRP/FNR family transcriptional regulator, anaerobic regulatory protein|nr:Crp/Fnr family transcriptional regulator [Flavobacterium sp.]HQV35301.1 Crp/Fnr family transcriptional regulator [Flavobacterium sp.]HQX02528.1 Crp/Fnr family transcriptional regulator [Flavobacterium sp.]HRZ32940.1 Crp/Fnr family transcriptional regulator [Flavobacterium sp.]HRZ74309.1 Crp/Fnr family transcriptional regulator [Flavobacterium sp.]
MSLLLNHIANYISLTEKEQKLLLSKTETVEYKAKTILLNAGEICKYSYFVNSGLLRSFNINDNIVEHVLHFACEGWWIGDMYSLLSQKPGNLFIEVLEDSEVVLLSKENQELLYHEIPKLERFFRILTENSLVAHQERLMDNLSLSAEERFEKFCKRYPTLIQRVPQKQIASYIGVTPEFFSKMKSKLLRK